MLCHASASCTYREAGAVDGLAAGAVAAGEVTTLDHCTLQHSGSKGTSSITATRPWYLRNKLLQYMSIAQGASAMRPPWMAAPPTHA